MRPSGDVASPAPIDANLKIGRSGYDPPIMQWPGHLPDGCPPADAEDANGTVIRLVKGDAPAPDDFQSQYERNPNRSWGEDLCRACGLSVFRTPEDAKALARRIPAFRNSRIASADLDPTMGKIQHTPSRHASTHHTWWPPTTVSPPSLFSLAGDA